MTKLIISHDRGSTFWGMGGRKSETSWCVLSLRHERITGPAVEWSLNRLCSARERCKSTQISCKSRDCRLRAVAQWAEWQYPAQCMIRLLKVSEFDNHLFAWILPVSIDFRSGPRLENVRMRWNIPLEFVRFSPYNATCFARGSPIEENLWWRRQRANRV